MNGNLSLVMTGGGARAAYQVGLLRVLARHFPELEIPILTSVSAGAINAAHLANHSGTLTEATRDLAQLWRDVRTETVFDADVRGLMFNFAKWGLRLGSGSSGLKSGGLVDTSPLHTFLSDHLGGPDDPMGHVEAKIRSGRLKAFAVTATNYGTGQTITWVQGRNLDGWQRPNRRGVCEPIGIDHVMASAALPLFFPAIKVGGGWFGDGGIRLMTPLSPSIKLGAERILAISTRYSRTFEEADRSAIHDYPAPAQVVGVLMNAVFLDALDQDAIMLERINTLIKDQPEEKRGGFRPVKLMVVRPSQDLSRLAAEYETTQPRMVRFLMRGLGTRESESPDWLSMVLFEPAYIERMMEIGEADAEARIDELAEFLNGD
ncbi:patatin-like phospholipase family protein [soil metagenome]